MKHPVKVAAFFLIFFLLIHSIGLYFVSVEASKPLSVVLDAPQPVSGGWSILYLLVGVGIGTGLILLLAKYGKKNIWKGWFTLATAVAIMYGLATVLPDVYAVAIGVTLATLRLIKPNFVTHNLAELFMYGGIGLILAPLFSPVTALITFFAMSVYDAYAVWKSKHMITLAEFTKDANTFPGLSIGYNKQQGSSQPIQEPEEVDNDTQPENDIATEKTKKATGILGGGDVLFPLLVANTVYLSLYPEYTALFSFLVSFGVSISAAVGLAYLFFKPTTAKYHPALPYIFAPVLLYTTTVLIFT